MNRFTSQGWLTGGFSLLLLPRAVFITPAAAPTRLNIILLTRVITKKDKFIYTVQTLGSAAVWFQETIHLRGTPLAGLLGCLPPPSKYNWVSDNRSFNITLLQYRRIVRGPGRDIEWEPRVPPFRLGRASELIRQINERWADVGARPPSVPVCHLLVPWIPALSDSGQLFSGHHLSASVTHAGTVRTKVGCFCLTGKSPIHFTLKLL